MDFNIRLFWMFAFPIADNLYSSISIGFLFVICLLDLIMDSQITEVIGWLACSGINGYY